MLREGPDIQTSVEITDLIVKASSSATIFVMMVWNNGKLATELLFATWHAQMLPRGAVEGSTVRRPAVQPQNDLFMPQLQMPFGLGVPSFRKPSLTAYWGLPLFFVVEWRLEPMYS